MTTTRFLIQDKESRDRFFEKFFLLLHISMEEILEMLFLSLHNVNVELTKRLIRKFTWRTYNAIELLSITEGTELINKHKFAKTVLNENFKIFVVYVVTLGVKA